MCVQHNSAGSTLLVVEKYTARVRIMERSRGRAGVSVGRRSLSHCHDTLEREEECVCGDKKLSPINFKQPSETHKEWGRGW